MSSEIDKCLDKLYRYRDIVTRRNRKYSVLGLVSFFVMLAGVLVVVEVRVFIGDFAVGVWAGLALFAAGFIGMIHSIEELDRNQTTLNIIRTGIELSSLTSDVRICRLFITIIHPRVHGVKLYVEENKGHKDM